MSRIALGTVQFGLHYGIGNQTGLISYLDAKAMMQFASNHGIDMLDTAISYGNSEQCLGEVGTKGFKLITKLPPLPDDVLNVGYWVEKQMVGSLARLGVKDVYGLLLHRPLDLIGKNGTDLFWALQNLKGNGTVKKFGVSIYSPNELEILTPNYDFDLVQAPFNLFDQRLHRSGWLRRLADSQIEIHTRSAFLQGLLLFPHAQIPNKFSKWHSLWNVWHTWLSSSKLSAVEACLAFPLSFPEVAKVIVGADTLKQLEHIIYSSSSQILGELPNLHIEDENLINPANWVKL